jgi:DNA polymerase I-like protein with 3'-5' exonuclease and polymerase domains
VEQLYSRRIRGGTNFTSEANGDFQALLADIAGRAQFRVSREQYADKASVLYGSRSVLFAHDELFGEAREDVAADVAERVKEIMIEEFRKGCPNHVAACKAEPAIMRRWYKQAECVRNESGRLIPWEPQ